MKLFGKNKKKVKDKVSSEIRDESFDTVPSYGRAVLPTNVNNEHTRYKKKVGIYDEHLVYPPIESYVENTTTATNTTTYRKKGKGRKDSIDSSSDDNYRKKKKKHSKQRKTNNSASASSIEENATIPEPVIIVSDVASDPATTTAATTTDATTTAATTTDIGDIGNVGSTSTVHRTYSWSPNYKSRGKITRYGNNDLKSVWLDTIVKSFRIYTKTKMSVLFDQQMNIYPIPDIPDEMRKYDTNIQIVDNDTFTVAQSMYRSRLNPLVLNMACDTRPGGGVDKGSIAQEEDLYRRSNIHLTLNESFIKYPIPDVAVVYSPIVVVFKDKDFIDLGRSFNVSVVSCAALKKPYLHKDKYYDEDYKVMKEKIKLIFKTAYLNGDDSLLLGALGCGAFRNPNKEVANIFRKIMLEYRGVFRQITFAILSGKNNDNFTVFREIILGEGKKKKKSKSLDF